MRIAVTCNGPGETSGWLRPLLRALYGQTDEVQISVFYVPDDYATGREPQYVRELFPQANVYDVKSYVRIALGGSLSESLLQVDTVLYLGGDLMHAARLAKRLRAPLSVYKFCRARYAAQTVRAFAIDSQNAAELAACGIRSQHIVQVGNLAIDGAFAEAQLPPENGAPADGVLIMPGSRTYEVRHLVPFFFTAALAIHREDPQIPIAFGISPFTSTHDLRAAVEGGGDPRWFARKGRLLEENGSIALTSLDGTTRFPVLRAALAAARVSRLAITIPGTKVIELSALGVPVVSCTPLNAPEMPAINGPLTYLDRIPLVGIAAKRAVVTAYSRRHTFHTQPNIDAQAMIVRELHGTLTPGRVARVALESADDSTWLTEASQRLSAAYRRHEGAAARMAAGILDLNAVTH